MYVRYIINNIIDLLLVIVHFFPILQNIKINIFEKAKSITFNINFFTILLAPLTSMSAPIINNKKPIIIIIFTVFFLH